MTCAPDCPCLAPQAEFSAASAASFVVSAEPTESAAVDPTAFVSAAAAVVTSTAVVASAFMALVVVVLVLLAVQGYRAGTTLTGTFLAGTILFGTTLVSTALTGTTLAGTFVDTTITGTTLVGTIQASLIARAPAGLGAQPSLWAVRPCRRCIGVATAAFRGLRECAARRIFICCRYYCPADAITVAITLVRPGNSCNSVAITVIAREATHSNSCNSESLYYWRYYSD